MKDFILELLSKEAYGLQTELRRRAFLANNAGYVDDEIPALNNRIEQLRQAAQWLTSRKDNNG